MGQVVCSESPGGDAAVNGMGQVRRGAGQCVQNGMGQVMCSSQPGGGCCCERHGAGCLRWWMCARQLILRI
jgi:hypothetical protein